MFFNNIKLALYLKLNNITSEQLGILAKKVVEIHSLNAKMRLFSSSRVVPYDGSASALVLIFNWGIDKDNYIQFAKSGNYSRDPSFSPVDFQQSLDILNEVLKKFKINPINLKLKINLVEIKYKNAPTSL